MSCDGQQEHARERERHADRQRIRLRPPVCVEADDRLQQRGGELVGQRDQTDLAEIEVEAALEDRIDRRQQRLHHVVQQVAEAQRRQDAECRARGEGTGAGGHERRSGGGRLGDAGHSQDQEEIVVRCPGLTSKEACHASVLRMVFARYWSGACPSVITSCRASSSRVAAPAVREADEELLIAAETLVVPAAAVGDGRRRDHDERAEHRHRRAGSPGPARMWQRVAELPPLRR